METVSFVMTALHLMAAIAWLGGMVFHIFVLDPVFRDNEISVQSAFLLSRIEGSPEGDLSLAVLDPLGLQAVRHLLLDGFEFFLIISVIL